MKTYGATIQKISLQQYFHISLFALLFQSPKDSFPHGGIRFSEFTKGSSIFCSTVQLSKENDICSRFLRDGNKMILTKKGLQQQTLNLKLYQHRTAGNKITHVAKLSLT